MKRTFKKTLTLLLMLAMLGCAIFAMSLTVHAASDYVTINNIRIKDGQYLRENDSTATYTMPGSGSDYAYYKSGVLTLINFNITANNDFAVIYTSKDKLTINLTGTNSINTSYGYAFRTTSKTILTFMGSGSLTIDCSANYAIHCSDLAIAGGTLTVKAAGYALIAYDYIQTGGTVNLSSSKDYQALWVQGPADISGGTLTVEASNCSFAAVVDEDMTVSGGTVNIKPNTGMAGVAVGGTYTQTGGTVNLATKGYAGIATTGTGKVTLTGGDFKVTGDGIGLQTAKASVEIGRCDVIMEGVSTGIDCAGTVTINGNGITKITATKNGISCKAFNITKTGEFLVSGQSGLAVASSDKSWTVASKYATSVSTNYQGKDAVPLSNQSVKTAKYFYSRGVYIYIAGIPMSYGEYLPKNGQAASTYKLSDNYIHTQANGERLEVIVKNCDIAATGSTEGIKSTTNTLITGSGSFSITSQSGSAILLSSGSLFMDNSDTVNIKSNSMNGIVLQKGSYVQTNGTVNIEAGNGILAAQGDVTISKGALNVKSTGIGITTKNLQMNGTSLDVTGSTRALLLTGSLTAKSGLTIQAATTATGTLGTYNSANIDSYKRVFVGGHVCSGGTATCRRLAQCSTCGKAYGSYADHVWSKTWDVTTKDGHAHKCTTSGCSATSTVEKHTPGAAATEASEQRCTTCNYIIAPKLNHTHKTTKVAAVAPTCDKNGNVEYYTCSGCSKIFQDAAATREFASRQDTISPALGHKFTDAWNADATNHWHACSACGAKEGIEKHTPGAAATETTDQTCTVCAYVINKAAGHTHTFSDHWFNDNATHWKACNCGEISDKADHADTNGDAVCDSCHWALSAGETTAPTEGTDPTDGTDSNDTTDSDNDAGEQDPADKQTDGDNTSSALITVVIVIAVLLFAACAVLVLILIKRKMN
jgi:hypothetical protein